MLDLIKINSNGRILMVLEGGYNVGETSKSLLECGKVLIQDERVELETNGIQKEQIHEIINSTILLQQKFWNCFRENNKK
jgi:acetoin utilization deacetylase AcuC-like enzyme